MPTNYERTGTLPDTAAAGLTSALADRDRPAARPRRRQQARAFAPLLVDLLVPAGLYLGLHAVGVTPWLALSAAGLATGVAAAVSSWRRRRLDGLGLLVVVEIVVSVALMLVARDPRLVLLKPSLYTLVAAVYLYTSCAVGRPVVYEAAAPLASQGDPDRLHAYQQAWETSLSFRRRERLVTAGFGTALLLEAVLRVVIVLALPPQDIGRALIAGQLPGLALIAGALLLARSQAPALSRVVDQLQHNPTARACGPDYPAAKAGFVNSISALAAADGGRAKPRDGHSR